MPEVVSKEMRKENENMENQDFFREIAMTKHPIGTMDKEVVPLPVPKLWFQVEEEADLGTPWEEKRSFEEQCEKFHSDLEALRIQYRPYLQDYLPVLPAELSVLPLKKFEFRYLEPGEVFTERDNPDKKWENITIPDYRGPAEEKGRWQAYYRCIFTKEEIWKKKPEDIGGNRVVLDFQCVDYIGEIYINGNYVGSHEGFFAPFSFDITPFLKDENELIVLCKNEIPILGTGPVLDGDKIYAATGPGWDDPYLGWHHCPAGAGVFGKVELQIRPEIYLDDVFVRPDIDQDCVEVRLGIQNYTEEVMTGYELTVKLLPRNYEGRQIGEMDAHISYIGPGKNEYRYRMTLEEYRLWNPETPWLYGAQALIRKDGQVITCASQNFGMKKFLSDENSNPKGKFYLNHKPIALRGANEMGHLQQCVMQGNHEQLIDDILIAKLCNMNYYRITQRPVQEEIYDYFDMLGMMHQCDFPLFGFLRRPQFAEALRQVGEMEHLIRGHVSSCMVTFINEPMCIRRTENLQDKFSKRYEAKGHRHLLRDELEAFFAAARKAIYVENPDRVIKNVEGDYDGPTAEGMPDFHSYTMWYTNHGEPIGKLMRGYLPPVKEGWMIGCGEYGAEGLDNESIIRHRYPKEWLAVDQEGHWYPDKIIKAQSHSVQGDWYEEQDNIPNWVKESQIHQARATKLMTDAYRRRGDVMNHTAIHLLIDAWPAGWMKTLVDCEREPKRAYFAYQAALEPLRINLYTGRNWVYEDETIDVEAWLLNDTGEDISIMAVAAVWEEGEEKPYESFTLPGTIEAANAGCMGRIPISFQKGGNLADGRTVYVKAVIKDETGKILNQETITFQVYKKVQREIDVYTIGREARELCGVLTKSQKIDDGHKNIWVSSQMDTESMDAIGEHVKGGGRGILLLPEDGCSFRIDGHEVSTKDCGDLFFAAAKEEYRAYPLGMIYNRKKEYIDATANRTIETTLPGEALIFTYDKKGFNGSYGAKPHLPFVKECMLGEGRLILVSLCRQDRIGYNPGLDKLLMDLIGGK